MSGGVTSIGGSRGLDQTEGTTTYRVDTVQWRGPSINADFYVARVGDKQSPEYSRESDARDWALRTIREAEKK